MIVLNVFLLHERLWNIINTSSQGFFLFWALGSCNEVERSLFLCHFYSRLYSILFHLRRVLDMLGLICLYLIVNTVYVSIVDQYCYLNKMRNEWASYCLHTLFFPAWQQILFKVGKHLLFKATGTWLQTFDGNICSMFASTYLLCFNGPRFLII